MRKDPVNFIWIVIIIIVEMVVTRMLVGTFHLNSLLTHSLTLSHTLSYSFSPYNPSPTQANNDFIDHLAINRSITSYEASYEEANTANAFTSPVVVMAPVGDDHSNLSTLFQVAPMDTGIHSETAVDDDNVAGNTSLLTHGNDTVVKDEAISDAAVEDVGNEHRADDTGAHTHTHYLLTHTYSYPKL